MNKLIKERMKHINEPQILGSYSKEDCIFLLRDVTSIVKEQTNEERELAIQTGTHYSEMLPIEYVPKPEYVEVFHKMLNDMSSEIAKYVGVVSDMILKQRGKDVILVSLARAGTPIGVLIKKYIKEKHNLDLPHYSISIIRGKGFDKNALCYILDKHNTDNLQFIDGWTGKGAINSVLQKACEDFEEEFEVKLDPTLAVLADPAQCVPIFGTREDIVIPSACLNSTVSGLMSRSFQKEGIIGEYDFHGSKFYSEWKDIDLSNYYINEIAKHFAGIDITEKDYPASTEVLNTGIKEVMSIGEVVGIENLNLIKSGINETSRVLLRRVPWKILVDRMDNPHLKHILMLAQDRSVPVEIYKDMNYSCCGLIKQVTGEKDEEPSFNPANADKVKDTISNSHRDHEEALRKLAES